MPDAPVPLALIPFTAEPEVDEIEGVNVTETLYCTCGATAFAPTVSLTKHDGQPRVAPLYLCVRCGSTWRVVADQRAFQQVTASRPDWVRAAGNL